jgi:hypothetical protein
VQVVLGGLALDVPGLAGQEGRGRVDQFGAPPQELGDRMLWRRVLRQHGSAPDLGEFTRLGLLTVPAALVLGVLALWGGLHLLGG